MRKRQKSKKNKAQAMVVVFIYISVVSLMGIYMMVYAANLNNIVTREINHTQAFYAGEAALIQGFSQMCNEGAAALTMDMGFTTIDVTTAAAPDNYTRIRARVSGWQKW